MARAKPHFLLTYLARAGQGQYCPHCPAAPFRPGAVAAVQGLHRVARNRHRRPARRDRRAPGRVGPESVAERGAPVGAPPPRVQTERRASVGDSRAARIAGYSPASAPITIAAPRPAARAAGGTTGVQPRFDAYATVMPAPSAAPASPPVADSSSDSPRNCATTWRRAAPSARRRPISDRRSRTEITMTLAMPTPPTSSATAPSPRNRVVSDSLAAARACNASEGRL